jgi:insulysin
MKSRTLFRALVLCLSFAYHILFTTAFHTANLVQRPHHSFRRRELTKFRAKNNPEDPSSPEENEALNISQNGGFQDLLGVSRREFVVWSAAGASLSTLYDPSVSAKPSSEEDASGENFYSPVIPFSSVRRYKSVRLANGMEVLLVSDKLVRQATVALTIRGAGQFSNPPDLDGLAHLMEHMTLSSSTSARRRKSVDFEEWLADFDGASNGFTAYETVCYHFNCPSEVLPEALARFARLFLQEVVEKVCKNKETLKREIRRVDSEIDGTDGFLRELYLVKTLINPNHPYSRLSVGNLETLEDYPTEAGIDVGQRLIQFFKERYLPSRAVLVVVSPNNLSSLESWVAPFASTMSRERMITGEEEEQRIFPELLLKQNRFATICLFRKSGNGPGEDLEKLSFQWALNMDYGDMRQQAGRNNVVTATQIGFVLSQILGRRGPGSLYTLLKQRSWIPDGSQGLPRISFPVDVSGFQMLKLDLSLTIQGFSSRSAVIAAVYDSINSLQSSPLSTGSFLLRRVLIAEYATVAQLYGHVLTPRPPDAVELALDAQVYGADGPKGVSNPEWRLFPLPQDNSGISSIQKCLQETLTLMSDPGNAIIITTACKKAIIFAEKNVLENSFPLMSPASWNISPVTGARYYLDNMFRLSGRVNEWLVARSMVDELSPPVLNPLIPPTIRPPRIPNKLGSSDGSKPLLLVGDVVVQEQSPILSWKNILRRNRASENYEGFIPEYNEDIIQSSIVRDYWSVLQVISHEMTQPMLRLPRVPPEPSSRCAFVLQLLSSRPARADTKMAAHAELWKVSLEYAVSDLVSKEPSPISNFLTLCVLC